jgi:hypothetical protein
MEFRFVVSAEAERDEGKFASRDEIEEQLQEAISGADPGSVEGEAGGTYSIVTWEVEAEDVKPRKAKAPAADLSKAIRAVTGGLLELNNWQDDSDEGAEAFEAKLKLVSRQADGLFLQLGKLGLLDIKM